MSAKKKSFTAKVLGGPDELAQTIVFNSDGTFEILESGINGIITYALDNLLAPDVYKGNRLLVNTGIKTFDGDGLYVFEAGKNLPKGIAKLEKLPEGKLLYTFDSSHPIVLDNMDDLVFVGKVHDILVQIPYVNAVDKNGKLYFDAEKEKKHAVN